MKPLTCAITKGRLSKITMEMFEKAGFSCNEIKEKSRKLIFEGDSNMKYFLSKAGDVPTYVEYGAADIGICGRDVILEEKRNLYEVLDLGFGKCKMVVAGHPEMKEKLSMGYNIRIATKYPKVAKDYFYKEKGQTVEIIKLNGSVELGPIVGLADAIVDIVETGDTIRENGLVVLETICDISARMVVNRVSMKLEHKRIFDLIGKLSEVRDSV